MGAVDSDNAILTILGVPLDEHLSFAPLVARARTRIAEAARQVFAATESTGFGLPYQVGQWDTRVVSKALYGVEFAASYYRGWSAAGRALTLADG